jgi:hypothetical protein
MHAEVLFAEPDGDGVTLDLVAVPSGAPFSARVDFPERCAFEPIAVSILRAWARAATVVRIATRRGRRGPQLVLSTSESTVWLDVREVKVA